MLTSIKIALIGHGKMGRLLEELADKEGCGISAIIDPKQGATIDAHTLRDTDVCIDFSHPNHVLENILKVSSLGKNMVVGTTGWYQHLDRVKGWIKQSGTGLLYSPNFSVGVNLFLKTVEHAASLYLKSGLYQAAGFEAHHSQKADAPSGTALALTQVLSTYQKVPFSSVRCGSIPGTHTVLFDSPADTITLTHQARDRSGFARGALDAAKWMKGRQGIYTMEDFLECKE